MRRHVDQGDEVIPQQVSLAAGLKHALHSALQILLCASGQYDAALG